MVRVRLVVCNDPVTELSSRSRRDRADERKQGRAHRPPRRQQWAQLQGGVCQSSRSRGQEGAS